MSQPPIDKRNDTLYTVVDRVNYLLLNSALSVDVVKNLGNVPQMRAGLVSNRPATDVEGTIYIGTDDNRIYQFRTNKWVMVGGTESIDWSKVLNKEYASETQDGILSASDYTLFNNKEDAANKGKAGGYAPLDADGYVPAINLSPSIKEIRIVNDIAARDAITDKFEGLRVHVKDASADPTVTDGGWAEYLYENGVGWTKTAEKESIDVVLDWANLQHKPTSAVADIDSAVTHSKTTGNPHKTTKADLGLGKVENKSSADIRSEIVPANLPDASATTKGAARITDEYSGTDTDAALSQKGANALYQLILNKGQLPAANISPSDQPQNLLGKLDTGTYVTHLQYSDAGNVWDNVDEVRQILDSTIYEGKELRAVMVVTTVSKDPVAVYQYVYFRAEFDGVWLFRHSHRYNPDTEYWQGFNSMPEAIAFNYISKQIRQTQYSVEDINSSIGDMSTIPNGMTLSQAFGELAQSLDHLDLNKADKADVDASITSINTELQAVKQSGVDAKQKVVDALNAKKSGMASTTDTWDTIAGVIGQFYPKGYDINSSKLWKNVATYAFANKTNPNPSFFTGTLVQDIDLASKGLFAYLGSYKAAAGVSKYNTSTNGVNWSSTFGTVKEVKAVLDGRGVIASHNLTAGQKVWRYVDEDGLEVWAKTDTVSPVEIFIRGGNVWGLCYIASSGGTGLTQTSSVQKLDVKTGTRLWYRSPPSGYFGIAFTVDLVGSCIAAYASYKLVKYDAEGNIVFSEVTSGTSSQITAVTSDYRGYIYAADLARTLHCFSPLGSLQWSKTFSDVAGGYIKKLVWDTDGYLIVTLPQWLFIVDPETGNIISRTYITELGYTTTSVAVDPKNGWIYRCNDMGDQSFLNNIVVISKTQTYRLL